MKVLAVDDHQSIIDAVKLCINLRWPTARIVVAYDGESAIDTVKTEIPDIVILDIGLPDMDGYSVLENLRQFSSVPVIMLTVRDSDIDIARGLEMGADDYITKPFSHVELLARMEAVLRRTAGRSDSSQRPLTAGDLWMDFQHGEVLVKREPVQLTSTELRVLRHLIYNAGRAVTHDSLVAAIWGTHRGEKVDTHTVTVHMRHLRAKLGDSVDSPKYITTVRGIGYKFLEQTTVATATELPLSDSPTDREE
ncbi:MAG: response regulator transcription factor [Dehalococcoidales bacterium]|nr:response regulator transcription factor [Dehalococcoidales bacterium]